MKTPDELISKVKRLKEGKANAFTDVYEESYKYLHTCVIHIVKNEDAAQDMLQDTYVEIFKNITQLKDEKDFLSWASTIANRKCFAYIKKDRDILVDDQVDAEGNESDFFENVADDESFIPENIFDHKEKINIIRGIIDDLTDVQRACVIGFYYNDQKQDEIAAQLAIPVNTVKSHLNRAKAKIKEAVSDIEKKQGVKLYSVSPFMLRLLSYEAKLFATKMAVPAAGVSLSAAITEGTSAMTSGTSTVAGKKVLATSIKSASSALKTKIVAGATATVVGVSAVVGIVNYNKKEPEPIEQTENHIDKGEDEKQKVDAVNEPDGKYEDFIDVYVDEKQILDAILVYDKPLSEISHEEVIKHWKEKEEYYLANNNGYPSYSYSFEDGSSRGSNKGWDDIEIIGDIESRYVEWRIDDEGLFSKTEYTVPPKSGALFSERTDYMEIADTGDDLQWLYEGTYTKYPKESQESFSERIGMRSDPYYLSWSSLYMNKEKSDEISGFNIHVERQDQFADTENPWGSISFDQAGMSLKEYLDSYIPGGYDMVKEKETISFQNGIITSNATHQVSGKDTWMFVFDESNEISKEYPRVILVVDENEILTELIFDTY